MADVFQRSTFHRDAAGFALEFDPPPPVPFLGIESKERKGREMSSLDDSTCLREQTKPPKKNSA